MAWWKSIVTITFIEIKLVNQIVLLKFVCVPIQVHEEAIKLYEESILLQTSTSTTSLNVASKAFELYCIIWSMMAILEGTTTLTIKHLYHKINHSLDKPIQGLGLDVA